MEHEAEPRDGGEVPELPLLPGFREMALRRMSAQRRRLVAELTAQRRSAGLSQTAVGSQLAWQAQAGQAQPGPAEPGAPGFGQPELGGPELGAPELSQPGLGQ